MMPPSQFKDITGAVHDCITGLGLLIAGLWAASKFILRRERFAKIQFDLELDIISRSHDHLIVDVQALVENKGSVRHWLRDFQFTLLTLEEGAEVTEGDANINYQVKFQPLKKNRYWIPEEWDSTFIDAGISQRYRYVTSLPRNTSVVLIYARFRYPDRESEFHTAQRVFSMTPSPK